MADRGSREAISLGGRRNALWQRFLARTPLPVHSGPHRCGGGALQLRHFAFVDLREIDLLVSGPLAATTACRSDGQLFLEWNNGPDDRGRFFRDHCRHLLDRRRLIISDRFFNLTPSLLGYGQNGRLFAAAATVTQENTVSVCPSDWTCRSDQSRRGELVAFVGPSQGCGKTTGTLRHDSRDLPKFSGRRDPVRLGHRRRQRFLPTYHRNTGKMVFSGLRRCFPQIEPLRAATVAFWSPDMRGIRALPSRSKAPFMRAFVAWCDSEFNMTQFGGRTNCPGGQGQQQRVAAFAPQSRFKRPPAGFDERSPRSDDGQAASGRCATRIRRRRRDFAGP